MIEKREEGDGGVKERGWEDEEFFFALRSF
jgi:hypothetical protein